MNVEIIVFRHARRVCAHTLSLTARGCAALSIISDPSKPGRYNLDTTNKTARESHQRMVRYYRYPVYTWDPNAGSIAFPITHTRFQIELS